MPVYTFLEMEKEKFPTAGALGLLFEGLRKGDCSTSCMIL